MTRVPVPVKQSRLLRPWLDQTGRHPCFNNTAEPSAVAPRRPASKARSSSSSVQNSISSSTLAGSIHSDHSSTPRTAHAPAAIAAGDSTVTNTPIRAAALCQQFPTPALLVSWAGVCAPQAAEYGAAPSGPSVSCGWSAGELLGEEGGGVLGGGRDDGCVGGGGVGVLGDGVAGCAEGSGELRGVLRVDGGVG